MEQLNEQIQQVDNVGRHWSRACARNDTRNLARMFFEQITQTHTGHWTGGPKHKYGVCQQTRVENNMSLVTVSFNVPKIQQDVGKGFIHHNELIDESNRNTSELLHCPRVLAPSPVGSITMEVHFVDRGFLDITLMETSVRVTVTGALMAI